MQNFGQSDFDKNGAFQSNSGVTHCLGGRLVFTNIKEGEKMWPDAVFRIKIGQCAAMQKISYYFLLKVALVQLVKKFHVTLSCAALMLDKDSSLCY